MPFLDSIVSDINDNWKASGAFSCKELCDCRILMYGLAETLIDSSQAEQNILTAYPGVIDMKGEVNPVQVNDSFDLTLYHKLETIVNSVTATKAFGDSFGEVLEVANMAVIAIAWRSKIRMQAHDLESILKNNLPDQPLKKLNAAGQTAQKSKINPGFSTFDKTALLQREFTRIELNYPDLIIFELKYLVNSTYKKECLDVCK